jgi:Ni,Fe-hydrogenase III small subunit/formate hydrogenlyase subunit 6/NADH:ubiquinone oxidoreductase subunit I
MLEELFERIRQGPRTISFPHGKPPSLPERFRGLPSLDEKKCPTECHLCADSCPTKAIDPLTKTIDLGCCLFCADCLGLCPEGAIGFSRDFRLAARLRTDLVLTPGLKEIALAEELDLKMKRLFGRSLKLRVVSAGGCGACEADVNVLGTIGWDLGRFGIQFVASPRHADGVLVTGPVTKNMELALKKTWAAVADPKIVIAVGACAISGGLYAESDETLGGVCDILPVDLFIPGCPPHPLTTLDGLLRLLGKLEKETRVKA